MAARARRAALPAPAHAPQPSPEQLRAVGQMLARTSLQVAQLPRDALQALAPVLAAAERETEHGLRAWLETARDGDARYTAQAYRNTLLHLRRALHAVDRIAPEMARTLGIASHAAGHMAARDLVREVARASEVFEGTNRTIPINTARVIAQADRTLIPRFRTSAARYVGQVRMDIHRELAIGVVRGETITDLTNRLQRLGGPRGAVAVRGVAGEPGAVVEDIGEGLFRRYRYWAERVVRTEVLNAYNEQIDESIVEARATVPDLVRRWDATADARLCDVCKGLHGLTARPGEDFPGGYDGAPAHPNCRCRVGAWRDEWSDVMREAGVEF